MLPPEIQPLSYRSFITPSSSPSPSSQRFTTSYSTDGYPNPNRRSSLSPSPTNYSRSTTTPGSRSTPSTFTHNTRIALALAPCAAFLLDLGGSSVLIILTLGLIISYILDSLNYKTGAFIGVWFSLILAQMAFFFNTGPALSSAFNSTALAVLASLLAAETTFLIGVWSSLQFKFVQLENPAVILALERLLFGCVPLAASSIFTWATVSALGMANASYYLMAFNCVFYWWFSLPRPSSFKAKYDMASRYHGGEVPDAVFILGPLESCFHALHLLFFPLMFHIVSHHSLLFSSWSSVADLNLLFFLPLLFLLYASMRNSLWWLTKNPVQLQRIRIVIGVIALIVVVVCLEVRVVFHSFGRYIQVPAPYSYVLVTATMLGGAAAVAAFALGMIADGVSSLAFLTLAVVASAAGAVVAGFPIWVCMICSLLFRSFCFSFALSFVRRCLAAMLMLSDFER